MSDLAPAPESITMDVIRGWDAPTMKRYMAGPLRETIFNVIAVAETQRQEKVAAQQQLLEQPITETAPDAAAQAAAAQADQTQLAETQRVEAERKAAEQAAVPKKSVIEYQVTDENGAPIGRPTHLEAATQEELIAKMKEAHIQATRAFHRLKGQKVTSLREANATAAAQLPATVPTMSDVEVLAALKELKSDDPKIALEAHRKLTAAEIAKVKAAHDAELAQVNENRRQESVSINFVNDHKHDFNPCQANVNLVAEYFKENQLPWTRDNLEVALHALESELASVVTHAPSVAPNPAPTPTVQTTSTVVAPVQATPTVTASVTPQANPVAVTPKPGVNGGGIIPGQNSGSRPASATTGLTAAEIKAWDGKTMREKMRNPHTRAQIEAFIRANPGVKLS